MVNGSDRDPQDGTMAPAGARASAITSDAAGSCDLRGETTTGPTIRGLFEAALALPAEARCAFLQSRSGDPQLCVLVERMLHAHESAAGLLDMAVESVARRLDPGLVAPEPATWLGRTIGGFRLTGVLGQGGSAVVFRAEKVHQGVTQAVAIKLFRQVLLTDFAVRRFRLERAAMTRLTHPNIARLIDGGTTETGIAYIVLELVEGVRLTEYVRNARTDTRGRLSLMVETCRAVDSAHRSLIVHRDLKPSNVLVTRDGFVKLLDFGIAKFLSSEEDATELAGIALTPAYAAPEQFHGGTITTATDVFSLGVLLSELLEVDGVAREEPGERHRGGRPGTPRRRARHLHRDIASVIRKATEHDPDQRYPSAGAFADDIERYLASRPVVAHAPSLLYRARKFCVRQRLVVAVLSMTCLFIIAAAGVALWQARVAVRHAAQAQREEAAARATRDFVVDVFRSTEPGGPRAAPVTVVEVIDKALARVDTDRELGTRAKVDLRTQLGAVLLGQGQRGATDVLRRAFADARATLESDDPVRIIAGQELASALLTAGDFGAAERLLAEMEAALPAQRADLRAKQEVMAGIVDEHKGRASEAFSHIAKAVDHCADGCSSVAKFDVLTTQGSIYGTFERYEESAQAWQSALSIARQSYGTTHASVAHALTGLNNAYRRLGRLDEAKRLALEVLEIDDRILLPETHTLRALHLHHLGNVHFSLGDFPAAADAFERALVISRSAFGDDNQTLDTDLHNLGAVNNRLGRFERAVEYLEEALRRQSAHNGASSRGAAYTRLILGVTHALKGDYSGGLPHLDRAIEDLDAAGAGSRDLLFDARRYRARVLIWMGDIAAALEATGEVLAMASHGDVRAPDSARLHAMITRGVAMAESGDLPAASAILQSSLARLAEIGLEHESQAFGNFHLANIQAQALACADSRARVEAGNAALARIPYVYGYLSSAKAAANAMLAGRCSRPGGTR